MNILELSWKPEPEQDGHQEDRISEDENFWHLRMLFVIFYPFIPPSYPKPILERGRHHQAGQCMLILEAPVPTLSNLIWLGLGFCKPDDGNEHRVLGTVIVSHGVCF